MKDLTPRKIVAELDKYIIGQADAKRAVAIAIRNRWRRQQLDDKMAEEVMPKNIIMIGPTGVGKTEIARRLAALVKAPFLKVEASKYTEVGYHGRDVESMVRDLVDLAMNMTRNEHLELVREKAEAAAEERLMDILLPLPRSGGEGAEEQANASREKMRKRLVDKKLEDRMVEITVEEKPMVVQGVVAGIEEIGVDFQNMIERMIPSRTQTRKVPISEARKILFQQEADKLIDKEKMTDEALHRAENMGIIFLDELDKIAGREKGFGPDVSREGVQRDLLPIVEGSTVATRYGMVRTDHVLFIAAGAFHVAKPSDLIPELQGRFPIRVELQDLGEEEFVRILTEPENALTKQYKALIETEGMALDFKKDAIREIAKIAADVNRRMQNIGARRLQTVMEKVLEEVSFNAPDMEGVNLEIDAKYVKNALQAIIKDEDLSRYIL
ncbi:MAG: ATP-dependent protease ATPase subunit HslU [Planctomycetota bacterium]